MITIFLPVFSHFIQNFVRFWLNSAVCLVTFMRYDSRHAVIIHVNVPFLESLKDWHNEKFAFLKIRAIRWIKSYKHGNSYQNRRSSFFSWIISKQFVIETKRNQMVFFAMKNIWTLMIIKYVHGIIHRQFRKCFF